MLCSLKILEGKKASLCVIKMGLDGVEWSKRHVLNAAGTWGRLKVRTVKLLVWTYSSKHKCYQGSCGE